MSDATEIEKTFLDWYKKQKNSRPLTRSEKQNIVFLLHNINSINWLGDTMYIFRTVKDYSRSINRDGKRKYNIAEKAQLIWLILTNKIQ